MVNYLQLQLNRIEAKIDALTKKDMAMAVDLTAMTAEITKNTTVVGSVEMLFAQLTALIKNIPPSTDPVTQAALDELTATLVANDAAVAAAVVANTPSI